MIGNNKIFKRNAIQWFKLNDLQLNNNTSLAWVYPWPCHQCHKGLQNSSDRRMAKMTLTSFGSLNWLTRSQLTANDTIDIATETKLSLQVTTSHLKTQETKTQSHIICCHEQSLYRNRTMSHSINVHWQAEYDFFVFPHARWSFRLWRAFGRPQESLQALITISFHWQNT